MNLDALNSNINSEEIDTIDLLPRAAKMEHLALLMNLPTAEALKEIVEATDLPLLNSFDLIEDPSQHLPVKLIHEYHWNNRKKLEEDYNGLRNFISYNFGTFSKYMANITKAPNDQRYWKINLGTWLGYLIQILFLI